jgi:hypothetical protein
MVENTKGGFNEYELKIWNIFSRLQYDKAAGVFERDNELLC